MLEQFLDQILCGDALEILRKLPDESVDCVITSPPYWSLRVYPSAERVWDGDPSCAHEWKEYTRPAGGGHPSGTAQVGATQADVQRVYQYKPAFCAKCNAWRGQLGLEPTFELYLEHLWQIFDEIKRVLKKTGTLWVNIGDTYSGSGHGTNDYHTQASRSIQGTGKYVNQYHAYESSEFYLTGGLAQRIKNVPRKSLCMIPEKFALGMIDRGWILRNKNIWNKPNHMPCSTKDRFTPSWEFVYFFTKNNKFVYYYNIKTGQIADKKPKVLKEGVDWDWRQASYGVPKRKKVSYWRGLDYWFDLNAVRRPLAEATIKRAQSPYYPDHPKAQLWRETQPQGGRDAQTFNEEVYGKIARGEKTTANPGDIWAVPYHPKGDPQIHGQRLPPQPNQPGAFHPLGATPGDVLGAEYQGKWKDDQSHYNYFQQRVNAARAAGVPHDLGLSHSLGANPGDFWTIGTYPFKGAHFSVFPPKLVETPIKAGCPAQVCQTCGKPRVKIYHSNWQGKREGTWKEAENLGKEMQRPDTHRQALAGGLSQIKEPSSAKFIGYTDCGCRPQKFEGGVVLDPFCGTGTTCLVAKLLGKHFIGIDIAPEYVEMAKKRLEKEIPLLLLKNKKGG